MNTFFHGDAGVAAAVAGTGAGDEGSALCDIGDEGESGERAKERMETEKLSEPKGLDNVTVSIVS